MLKACSECGGELRFDVDDVYREFADIVCVQSGHRWHQARPATAADRLSAGRLSTGGFHHREKVVAE